MTFIFIIISIFIYISLSNRISRLEERLQAAPRPPQPAVLSQTPSVSSISTPVVPSPSAAPIPTSVQQDTTEESLGKTLGIIGVFAVLFGIGFFLKYAFENNLISITGRLILGGIVGILSIVLGRLIKQTYEHYSHILSGGGIALLFITTYTAHLHYEVIGTSFAYLLLISIAAISVGLSIMDRRVTMAAIGVSGAFIAPFLITVAASTPELVGMLVYVLIINCGVAAIAYRYRWLMLQYIAFIGTIFTVLLVHSYAVKTLFTIELFGFLSIYFAIFLASSVFHHVVRKEMSDETDLFFIVANIGAYFALSFGLLEPFIPDAMGLFALGLSLVYFALAYLSFTTNKEDKLLNITLPLIAASLLTLAIPLHFHGKWITVAWLLEAVCLAIVDYAVVGKRLYIYSALIFTIGAFKLLVVDSYGMVSEKFMPIANGRFVLWVFAIACAILIAYITHAAYKREVAEGRHDNESLQGVVSYVGVVSQLLSVWLITSEIHTYYASARLADGVTGLYSRSEEKFTVSIAWTLYAAALTVVGFMVHIRFARILGVGLFMLTAGKIFIDLWDLGEFYRIVASIVFGMIALIASFLYAKYKDRIKSAL